MRWLGRFMDPLLPRLFYVLLAGRFINMVGNSLVFPFLAVFLASRLGGSLASVGLAMGAYGVVQVMSVLSGGVFADAWGRRRVMLLSLGAGAVAAYVVGIVGPLWALFVALACMGFSLPLFQPASMALVADLVPQEKLNESYALLRMASNAGIIIGPMVGGLLADHSFYWLFALDAVALALFFGLVLFKIPEARPVAHRETLATTVRGLKLVATDGIFLGFAALWAVAWLVYSQLYQVLPAYLHLDLHFPAGIFGYLAAENAVLVVALQIPIARLTSRLQSFAAMAVGVAFYGLGFLVMMMASGLVGFMVAVLVITLGENVLNPAAATWVALHAPAHLRGRYMGFQSLASRIGSAMGPVMGGALLTKGSGPWLTVTAVVAFAGAAALLRRSRTSFRHRSISA
jgi:MFS family permease